MNLKKKFREFFTLTRNNGGFTLVELIVVIAILAILAGIGVPAYSGYITKANMAADQALVSDVANALTLQYYADVENAAADFVILSTGNAVVGGTIAASAMQAAFGDNWAESAKLKYANWKDLVASTVSNESLIGSSFANEGTPAQMMETVTSLTDRLGAMAADASQDPLETLKSLGILSDEQAGAISNDLKNNYGLEYADGSDYANALSNSLVKFVMDEMANYTGESELSKLSEMATNYAYIYAWSQTSALGKQEMESLNAAIQSGNSREIMNAVDATMNKLYMEPDEGEDRTLYDDFNNHYMADYSVNDGDAILAIMKAANQITDGADMTQTGLYTSEEFGSQVNNYFNAVNSVGNMDSAMRAKLNAVGNGQVVVFLNENGACVVNFKDVG